MKNQKGITLIALIITILVLLILTGITLNLALGENGIIKKANNANEKYKEAANNEENKLEMLASGIEQYAYNNKVSMALNANDIFMKKLGNNPTNEDIETAISKTIEETGSGIAFCTISTQDDLEKIGKDAEHPLEDAVYILTNDITLNGEWTPIGTENNSFSAVINGMNHNIENLNFNTDSSNSGLIGYNNGAILNLNIESGTISSSEVALGAIAGANNGIINNCTSSENVSISSTACKFMEDGEPYGAAVGGIVGENLLEGTISNCINNADIENESKLAGGIAGYNYGIIENCENNAYIKTGKALKVIGSYSSQVGGIAGCCGDVYLKNALNSSIRNCVNNGKIEGTGRTIGGICGYSSNCKIENCSNNGDVIGYDVSIGGIVGQNEGYIEKSYNNSLILSYIELSSTSGVLGGICGANYGEITDCYTTENSEVKGENAYYVGGISGYSTTMEDLNIEVKIERCYNLGKVTGYSEVGGILGRNSGTYNIGCYVNSCFNNGIVTGIRYVGGIIGNNLKNTCSCANCYNNGSININPISSGYYLGGIIGINKGNISNCYNSGPLNNISTSSQTAKIGGVIGIASGYTSDSLDSTASVGEGYGTSGLTGIESKTSSELSNLASTLGSEFKNNSNGYPKLSWEE